MTKRGEQPWAYADHVWEWIIVAEEGEKCSPEWCFEHIIKNSEYKRLASALPEAFTEMGFNQYCFTVKREYID